MLFYVAVLIITVITSNISIRIDNFPILEYLGCKNCERVYVPVCGTDNVTYVNACRLNCLNSKKRRGPWIYISRYGPCTNFPKSRLNYSLW